MAKLVIDAALDAALDDIATCVTCTVCSSQPANFAAISGVALAAVTLTAGDGNGDWTVGDGDTSGRKLTMGQQTGVSITATGTATYVVWDDGSVLRMATTCTSQALTSGGTVTIPAVDYEIADPT